MTIDAKAREDEVNSGDSGVYPVVRLYRDVDKTKQAVLGGCLNLRYNGTG